MRLKILLSAIPKIWASKILPFLECTLQPQFPGSAYTRSSYSFHKRTNYSCCMGSNLGRHTRRLRPTVGHTKCIAEPMPSPFQLRNRKLTFSRTSLFQKTLEEKTNRLMHLLPDCNFYTAPAPHRPDYANVNISTQTRHFDPFS